MNFWQYCFVRSKLHCILVVYLLKVHQYVLVIKAVFWLTHKIKLQGAMGTELRHRFRTTCMDELLQNTPVMTPVITSYVKMSLHKRKWHSICQGFVVPILVCQQCYVLWWSRTIRALRDNAAPLKLTGNRPCSTCLQCHPQPPRETSRLADISPHTF